MYNAQFKTIFKLIAIDLMAFNVTFGQLFIQIGATKMFRYRLVGARRVILSNAENDSNFTKFWFWLTYYVNWDQKLSYHKIHVVYNLWYVPLAWPPMKWYLVILLPQFAWQAGQK